MKKTFAGKLAVTDRDMSAKKAKSVKGGVIAIIMPPDRGLIGLGNVGLASKLQDSVPDIIVGAGPGAPGGHVK